MARSNGEGLAEAETARYRGHYGPTLESVSCWEVKKGRAYAILPLHVLTVDSGKIILEIACVRASRSRCQFHRKRESASYERLRNFA
jgi:hypothetical protein